MQRLVDRRTLLALALLVASLAAHSGDDTELVYTRLYADADGVSRFSEVATPWQRSSDAGGTAETLERLSLTATELRFVRTPSGFESEWHTTSRRQFVFVVSGTVEFETRDGDKRRFQNGSVVLSEDTSGKGHITRNVGGGELVLALVTVPAE